MDLSRRWQAVAARGSGCRDFPSPKRSRLTAITCPASFEARVCRSPSSFKRGQTMVKSKKYAVVRNGNRERPCHGLSDRPRGSLLPIAPAVRRGFHSGQIDRQRTRSWLAMTRTASLPPAVRVHSLAEAHVALSHGDAVSLVSPPGAALHAGCGWWKSLIEQARAAYPDVPCMDILDCADGTGQAMAALRIGVTHLILWPHAPGRSAIVAIAKSNGGFVLGRSPPVAVQSRGGVPRIPGRDTSGSKHPTESPIRQP